ncbi:MAG: prolyl hydroxylase family protein [Hyphococcus sp.]
MSGQTPLAQQLRRLRLARIDNTVDYAIIADAPFTRKKQPGLRRVKSDDVQLYTWTGFLDADECAGMIRLIDANATPSTVVSNERGGDPFAYDVRRTSKSCHLAEHVAAVVKKVDRKIADAIGFDLSHADPIQAQKYDAGEEFQPHHDYFEPGTPGYENFCAEKGQRTWTFMVYLNEVKNGGATVFPAIHRSFKPKAGMAVIWNNLLPGGAVNPTTLHGGAPVKAGVKYIITKWFRERGPGPLLAPAFQG